MRVSREQVAENRRKILDAASRLFKVRGFESVTVAEIMKAAGLTHGGFYGHFQSKEDLIVQTLAHALAAAPLPEADLAKYANSYLSLTHRDNIAGGCPTAALATETVRQTPEARAVMTDGLRRQIEILSQSAPGKNKGQKRQAAIGSWAAMVGAVILARLSDDPQLSDEILKQTRTWIGKRRSDSREKQT